MTKAPVFALPNFMISFQLETNVLGSVIGVVLMQHDLANLSTLDYFVLPLMFANYKPSLLL